MRNELRKKIRKLRKKGFTLAELLIVVAIIAVLVAVSIPVFTGKLEQARTATTEANIRAAKAAAMADYMDIAKIKIKKENGLFAFMKDGIKLVVKASDDYTYADDRESGYLLYWYDAQKNSLRPVSECDGGFESAFNEIHPTTDTGVLYTDILVKVSTDDGGMTTRPYINGSGKVCNDVFSSGVGESGNNSGNAGGGGNNQPAVNYYNISVSIDDPDKGTVSASASQVAEGNTVTISLTKPHAPFDGWTITGDYEVVDGDPIWSRTITIEPKSDITAHANMRDGGGSHSG